jgi:hypothetical protein
MLLHQEQCSVDNAIYVQQGQSHEGLRGFFQYRIGELSTWVCLLYIQQLFLVNVRRFEVEGQVWTFDCIAAAQAPQRPASKDIN